MIGSKYKSRGVSLIEAVVALAVMGFGMLGVAALQGTLRHNSDVARQRAEAARIGSEAIEAMRSYSVVNASGGKISYADIISGVAAPQLNLPSSVAGTNATYTRTVQVFDNAAQNRKTVQVLVTWTDRTGTQQEVRFSTEIHRSPPELAAALIIPGSGTVTQRPGGRHPTIPRQAVLNPNGTSSFSPPGGGSTVWIFDNSTGVIKQNCTTVGPTTTCTYARFVSGYVSFATGSSQPTSADSESPSGNALPAFTTTPPTAGLAIRLTVPAMPPSPPLCFHEQLPGSPLPTKTIAYYCAVFVETSSLAVSDWTKQSSGIWSGQSMLIDPWPTPTTTPPTQPTMPAAPTFGDTGAPPPAYQVCRYTSQLNNNAVGTGTPPLTNDDHPSLYAGVDHNLVNQNFLVIRAPFGCPDDDPNTPLVNGRTYLHQP